MKLSSWCLGLFFICSVTYALDNMAPIVNQNVTIMQNSSPAQCTSSWNGKANPAIVQTLSGSFSGEAAGVMSCTGCALDNQSNCVCSKCYNYFN